MPVKSNTVQREPTSPVVCTIATIEICAAHRTKYSKSPPLPINGAQLSNRIAQLAAKNTIGSRTRQ